MTNYTITAEQMKQLLEAVESNAEAVEIEYLDRRKFWGENLPYRWEYLREQTEQAKVTLTMLQSLTPALAQRELSDADWQVIADVLGCFITRTQKDQVMVVLKAAGGGV